MKNIRKTLLFTTLLMCVFCTQAFASWFYDLTGNTYIYKSSTGGVAISAYSSTGADNVDYIEVISYVYINGSKYATLINYANDYSFTEVLRDYPFSGTYYVSTKHYAQDWTGNEEMYTDYTYDN